MSSPVLRWVEGWRRAAGRGVAVGLLDTDFDEQLLDLRGADLIARNFIGMERSCSQALEHGTHSVATLIGQGRYQICGIARQARLLVGKVVGSDGIADPKAVAEGIEWLICSGAQIVALPLGGLSEYSEISVQIERGSQLGVLFFAAAGNSYPDQVVFPARHPLVIAVAAADPRGNLLPECSREPRLDLVAPGWNIPAPIRGRVIRRRRGSSIACVIAAGMAVLALSSASISDRSISRASMLGLLQGQEGTINPL